MARSRLEIRVVLEGGGGIDCDPRPGRTMIVGPGHTFEQLATAISAAFARWDLSHLHDFRLADGRRVGFADEDFDEPQWLDHATLKVMDELKPGDEFEYVFDFGDHWRHRCAVSQDKVDPVQVHGTWPERRVPTWAGVRFPTSTGASTRNVGSRTPSPLEPQGAGVPPFRSSNRQGGARRASRATLEL